jgi:hypothetical protein
MVYGNCLLCYYVYVTKYILLYMSLCSMSHVTYGGEWSPAALHTVSYVRDHSPPSRHQCRMSYAIGSAGMPVYYKSIWYTYVAQFPLVPMVPMSYVSYVVCRMSYVSYAIGSFLCRILYTLYILCILHLCIQSRYSMYVIPRVPSNAL